MILIIFAASQIRQWLSMAQKVQHHSRTSSCHHPSFSPFRLPNSIQQHREHPHSIAGQSTVLYDMILASNTPFLQYAEMYSMYCAVYCVMFMYCHIFPWFKILLYCLDDHSTCTKCWWKCRNACNQVLIQLMHTSQNNRNVVSYFCIIHL